VAEAETVNVDVHTVAGYVPVPAAFFDRLSHVSAIIATTDDNDDDYTGPRPFRDPIRDIGRARPVDAGGDLRRGGLDRLVWSGVSRLVGHICTQLVLLRRNLRCVGGRADHRGHEDSA
jgi:hypothetical protein